MLQFFGENPLLLLLCFCSFTPGVLPMAIAFYLGRRGLPFQVKFTGWKREGDHEI